MAYVSVFMALDFLLSLDSKGAMSGGTHTYTPVFSKRERIELLWGGHSFWRFSKVSKQERKNDESDGRGRGSKVWGRRKQG